MPLFDFICDDCGESFELLVTGTHETPACRSCGGNRLTKQMAAHSSASGPAKNHLPGLKDTACCGSVPGQASGCAGPGSCCGRNS
ncbi:MAG TPA: FmdB family zinc ribbon protein [Desulfotignum sp.]|jgi:putative FmdB family regulatory protein|nr:FmdB family zinc ribbon protein [Desulfotignum sp.]